MNINAAKVLMSLVNILMGLQYIQKKVSCKVRDFIFYFSSSFVALPITIILSPIFAKVLRAYDFAAIGFFSSIVIFTAPIFMWSFLNYYMVAYYKNSELENQRILTSLFSFLVLIHIPLIVLVYYIINAYIHFTDSVFQAFPIVLIIVMNASFAIGFGFWNVKLKYERKSLVYFLLTVIKVLLVNLLSYIFIVKFRVGFIGKFLPNLIIDFLLILAFYFFVIKKFEIDWSIIRKAFKFSTPLVLSALLVIPIQNLDVIFLEKLNNVEEFALYNIANSIAGYFIMLPLAMFLVIEPDIFNLTGNRLKKPLILLFLGFITSIAFLAIIYFLFSEFLLNYLTAGRYLKAQFYIGPFIIAKCLDPILYFLGFILIALRFTKLALLNTVALCILSFIVYPLFISLSSFKGALEAKILLLLFWAVVLATEIIFRNKKYIRIFKTK